MIVYLDLIFFMNFAYDFLLLLTTGMVLKRKIKWIRIILSSLLGAISIFLLFININEYLFFIIKILISIFMIIISFKYISLRYTVNNLIYFYMSSFILAGFLYFLDNTFSESHEGLVFYFKGYSVNFILLIIISPIVLLLYIKTSKKLKNTFNNYYHIVIKFDDITIKALALYDNGNTLIDNISKKAVIIVNKKLLKCIYNIRSPVYVPFKTIKEESVMKCFKPSYVIFEGKKKYNLLIGQADYNFADGVDALLPNNIMEEK